MPLKLARLLCLLSALLLGAATSAQAQLVLRLPLDFSEFEQGASFRTTPFPVANSDYCDVIGDQPVGPFPAQCGEVDTLFGFQVGAAYSASVSATSLTGGAFSIAWFPYVACVREAAGGEVISGGSSSFCMQSIAAPGETIWWDLGGQASIPAAAPPGRYTAQVTLSVSGPGLSATISVPVEIDVQAAAVMCTVSTDGSDVDFGEASARQAGSVTLSSTNGTRTYQGGQFDPSGSSGFSLATLQVTTNAGGVTATISAPAHLTSGGSTAPYLSYLAYRDTATGPYTLGVTGSGAVSRAAGGDGIVGYRIGGRVTTTSTSPAGAYLGTVSLTFSCN